MPINLQTFESGIDGRFFTSQYIPLGLSALLDNGVYLAPLVLLTGIGMSDTLIFKFFDSSFSQFFISSYVSSPCSIGFLGSIPLETSSSAIACISNV